MISNDELKEYFNSKDDSYFRYPQQDLFPLLYGHRKDADSFLYYTAAQSTAFRRIGMGVDEFEKKYNEYVASRESSTKSDAEKQAEVEFILRTANPDANKPPSLLSNRPEEILSHFKPLSDDDGKPLAEKRCIFKPYFPLGKFSIVSADPGTGKTKVVDAIAALVTVGGDLCGIPCEMPGKVLIFSMEDDRDDHIATIRNCGGDMSKVVLPGQDDSDLDYFAKTKLTFGSPEVEMLINHYRPALVIFDPYQKYVGSKTDTDKANKLSEALTPLTLLSRKYDCHILVIAHNIKAQTSKLQYKFMGSVDFVGEARSAMMVVRDPDRLPADENIIIHIKSNNKRGKSIRYKIESIPGNEDYATIAWLGLEDYDERDYMLANRSLLQNKVKALTEISDEDPTVKLILSIMKENPYIESLRVGLFDFGKCYKEINGMPLKESISKEIKRVTEYLEQNHGLTAEYKQSRRLMRFSFQKRDFMPSAESGRCVEIERCAEKRLLGEQMTVLDG